nr:hypothetical protein [Tanacetum cinerariifolium]GFA17793.1 hypothetical protein [Tanacetum cinerariifolium]
MLIDISKYVNVIDSKRHVEKNIFDSFVRASSSAGVKHLILSRLTRYLNLSTGKALVNSSDKEYFNDTFFDLLFDEVISHVDVPGTRMLDKIARDGYGCL